jgi:hypothetical protein
VNISPSTSRALLIAQAVAVHLIEFARTSPTSNTSKNPTGDFLSQYLPSSDCTSIAFAGPLPGRGHINGQVKNNYPYPIYVRQAVAEYSGVTGEKCEAFGETQDLLVQPYQFYISERPTYFDGCSTSRKLSLITTCSLALTNFQSRSPTTLVTPTSTKSSTPSTAATAGPGVTCPPRTALRSSTSTASSPLCLWTAWLSVVLRAGMVRMK